MRQLTMTADRQVEWWDVPEPALRGDGEALVRPLAVALCDLDQPILRGEAPIPGPIAAMRTPRSTASLVNSGLVINRYGSQPAKRQPPDWQAHPLFVRCCCQQPGRQPPGDRPRPRRHRPGHREGVNHGPFGSRP